MAEVELTQGCRCAPTIGLKLAHAFGVMIQKAHAFGVMIQKRTPSAYWFRSARLRRIGSEAHAFGVLVQEAHAFGVLAQKQGGNTISTPNCIHLSAGGAPAPGTTRAQPGNCGRAKLRASRPRS